MAVPASSPAMRVALRRLQAAVETPGDPASLSGWRWSVRQRMPAVREALMAEAAGASDGWLAARGGTAFRERNVLLGRLAEMSTRALEAPDAATVREEVLRLVADIARHVQRLHDLAYDEVEIELGGSE